MNDQISLDVKVRHCRYRQDPSGQVWGPRTIPDYEFVLIIQGRYVYSDMDGQLELRPGDLLLIEPEIEHTFRKIHEPGHGIHACAHFDLIDPQGNIHLIDHRAVSSQRVVRVDNFNYARMVFEQAAQDFVSYSKFHSGLVNNAIQQIWLRAAEQWYSIGTIPASNTIALMMEYLRQNLTRPVTRKDLARHFHYTPEHINYLFKKQLGISPSRFLNRERAIRAFKYLCEDGMSVQQAAVKTGFSSPYYFSRVFKDIFGYPPARVKKYIDRDLDGIFDKH